MQDIERILLWGEAHLNSYANFKSFLDLASILFNKAESIETCVSIEYEQVFLWTMNKRIT